MAKSVKWMYPEMQSFLRARGGQWRWGDCDCVELLLHLVAKATGVYGDRSRYIDGDRSYREVVKWLGEIDNPMQPYIDFLEREVGLIQDDVDWHIGVIQTKHPIRLSSELVYPTDIAPGVIFNPPDMETCILHRAGFSPVTIVKDNIICMKKYRLEQG